VLRGKKTQGRDWIFSCYADKRMLRDPRWLLDGTGRLYDCGDRRDETRYTDVTTSNDPKVLAVRKRFETLLSRLPGPTQAQMKRWPKKGRSPMRRGRRGRDSTRK